MGILRRIFQPGKHLDRKVIRTDIRYKYGIGYGHNFRPLDKRIPYEILKIMTKNNPPHIVDGVEQQTWDSQVLVVRKKGAGRVIKEIDYNYPSFGTTAFCPFIWNEQWHAFIPKTYTKSEIINLETGQTVAETVENKASWCPTNYYVPCLWKDPRDGWVSPDCEIEDGYELDFKDFTYLNTAFMAGVFWGYDNEWLVYRLNLPEIMATGRIPLPDRDTYCFEFDYKSMPEIRQFMKMAYPEDADASFNMFHYYTQKYTGNGFRPKEET